MKRFAIACIAAMGLMVVGSTAVEAGHGFRGGRSFYGGHGFHGGHRVHNVYGGHRVHNAYGGFRNGGFGVYHDTSHYDYHPTQVIRHGNHLHVQPGHYDLHRTGHLHYGR